MTDDRVALIEALQKADDGNFLRSLAETVLQIIMEADVDGLIGAGRYERGADLFWASLSEADLTGADVSHANLRGVGLSLPDVMVPLRHEGVRGVQASPLRA